MWFKIDLPYNPQLTIICPVYNNQKYTRNIFNQIKALDPDLHSIEVIFFDDWSFDWTQDLRPDFKHIWIQNPKNEWVTYAWNYCIERATGNFLLVINNDIVITTEVIDEMKMLLKTKDDCFVANAKQMLPWGKVINWSETDTDNISWACWMVRRTDWKKIGPIPSQLIMFGNDDYIYLKVTQWLKKLSLRTQYPIFHFVSQTVKDYSRLSDVTTNDINQLCKIVKKNKWNHPKLFEMKEIMWI